MVLPSALRNENGFTLVELLVAMILMLIVMTATLTTLDSSNQTRTLNDQQNDAIEEARSTIDIATRQLRNLASPTGSNPSIDRAADNDFAFRTFDPSKKLVRYCLSTDAATPTVLYQMTLSTASTLTDPTTAYGSCKSNTSGWSKITRVASDVVNQRSPNNTPLFAYNGSTANTSTITNVRIQLIVDINSSAKRPAQTRLASGAALRNQNQPPVARFTVSNPGGGREFILNGTASADPEDHNLVFTWYAGVGATFTPDSTNAIGSGSTLDYTFPSGARTNYYFKLVVSDSNLTNTCPDSTGNTTNCSQAGPLSTT